VIFAGGERGRDSREGFLMHDLCWRIFGLGLILAGRFPGRSVILAGRLFELA
jgi:hypothetical protein